MARRSVFPNEHDQPACPAHVSPHQRRYQAHLIIVFAALALSREVQAHTGLATRNIIRQLRPLLTATIAINGTRRTLDPAISGDKQAILDALRQARRTH